MISQPGPATGPRARTRPALVCAATAALLATAFAAPGAAQPPSSAAGAEGGNGQDVKLVISHRDVVIHRGKAVIRLNCEGDPISTCFGQIRLRPTTFSSRLQASGGRAVEFGGIPGDDSDEVRIPLPAESRSRLARKGKAVAVVEAELMHDVNDVETVRRTVTLVQKR